MRPARFQEFAMTAFQRGPEVSSVEPWQDGTNRPYGVQVRFNAGTVMRLSITAVSATGEKYSEPEEPVTATPPGEIPLPDLFDGGKITPQRAELYLAALLNNSGSPEIAGTYAYSARETPAMYPGLGVDFHSGGKAHMLITAV
jgi:hypothetical protein